MKVLGFDNVFLPVGDLDAAVTFYRDVIGLPGHRRFDAMGSALFSVGVETPGLGVGVAEPRSTGTRPEPPNALPEPPNALPEPADARPEPADALPEPANALPEAPNARPEPVSTLPEPAVAPGPGVTKVWFEVPDARAAASDLADRGVAPITPPFEIPTGWTFEIRDPWGNILGFTDYTHRPELGRTATSSTSRTPDVQDT